MFKAIVVAMIATLSTSFSVQGTAFAKDKKELFPYDNCIRIIKKRTCVYPQDLWVETDGGTTLLRRTVFKPTEDELIDLLKEEGITVEQYRNAYFNEPRHQNWPMASVTTSSFARGLTDADGRKIYLPPLYRTIRPVNDQWAVVERMNGEWKLVTMGKTQTYRDLPPGTFNVSERGGGAADKPYLTYFFTNGRADHLADMLMLDRNAEIELKVPDVIRAVGEKDLWLYKFGDAPLATVKVEIADRRQGSVWFNPRTREVERLGNEIEYIRFHTREDMAPEMWKSQPAVVEQVATLPGYNGEMFGPEVYLAYHENGNPITDENLVGVVPVWKDAEREVVRAWGVLYSNGEDNWYHWYNPSAANWNLHPANAAMLGKNGDIIADVWVGRSDYGKLAAAFEEAAGRKPDVFMDRYGVFAKFFNDEVTKSASGITDWYFVYGENANGRFHTAKRDKREQTADDPKDKMTALNIAAALENERVAERARNWEKYAAEEAAIRKAYADALMARGGKTAGTDFWMVARIEGGKYLGYYWRQNGRLPSTADANDICRRFGSDSYECNLVWPWAANIYAGQQAVQDKANAEYAARVQMTSRKPPAYRRPVDTQGRCYDQGNGKEKCFYN
ncbi:hypothetical protein [Parvularcula sp. LCG005]|uniref:hypothetical protein n=1 Tax=Parvularcula sp. LCG005 TaxID=3078805 RepID=UPI0029421D12|nr:hypothetical protein [Parvularcula sp. LCG005]WOI52360.1 hypothetical protein RUI03_09370 [Parvularcula sp. LCG005]